MKNEEWFVNELSGHITNADNTRTFASPNWNLKDSERNAHFMAASQELFDAIEFLLDVFERHTAGYSKGYEINNLACENAKNAIAKALNK